MATNKKSPDPVAEIKRTLPEIAPWVMLAANMIAATAVLFAHYKKKTDEAFMVPYTHVHYIDKESKHICGDKYINKQHICDGRFLLVRAEKPTLDEFLKLGLTNEQWDATQKVLKQFQCEGPDEKGT